MSFRRMLGLAGACRRAGSDGRRPSAQRPRPLTKSSPTPEPPRSRSPVPVAATDSGGPLKVTPAPVAAPDSGGGPSKQRRSPHPTPAASLECDALPRSPLPRPTAPRMQTPGRRATPSGPAKTIPAPLAAPQPPARSPEPPAPAPAPSPPAKAARAGLIGPGPGTGPATHSIVSAAIPRRASPGIFFFWRPRRRRPAFQARDAEAPGGRPGFPLAACRRGRAGQGSRTHVRRNPAEASPACREELARLTPREDPGPGAVLNGGCSSPSSPPTSRRWRGRSGSQRSARAMGDLSQIPCSIVIFRRLLKEKD